MYVKYMRQEKHITLRVGEHKTENDFVLIRKNIGGLCKI